MLTFIFTLFMKAKREVMIAWETAEFHMNGGIVPDGLCGIGHAYDDHDEDERGVVDEFDDEEGGGGWILMLEDDDDE